LEIEIILGSKLFIGRGAVQGQEGRLPVPTPAALEILRGWPIEGINADCEIVTATGAAIITGFCDYSEYLPFMTIDRIGYGAAKYDLEKDRFNGLRIIVGNAPTKKPEEQIEDDLVVIETCIDDMNPEIFGYLMEKLFIGGALDVVWLPVFMKKNRPGTKIEVLCHRKERDLLIQHILMETTSLGVRFYKVARKKLKRCIVQVNSPWGAIQAKKIVDVNGMEQIVPEYEICRKIAMEKKIPLKRVYEIFNQQYCAAE
jgi:uncharacterized protein (DUF111 family)